MSHADDIVPHGGGRASHDAIEETAANWLAQREEGFSPQQAREFETWRRCNPRHAAAVARLEQACALLEKMPLVEAALLSEDVARGPRRAFASGPIQRVGDSARHPIFRRVATGMAAAVVIGAVAWWQWPRPETQSPPAHYATSAGGYERVNLADGSVLELNADSAAQVRFSARARRVTLTAGEAHFSVAHEAARPFIVEAGGVAVRAVGTAFNVRLASAAVEVLVTEGKVSVDKSAGPALAVRPSRNERENSNGRPVPLRHGYAGPATGRPTFVSANERVVIPTRPVGGNVPPLQIEKIEPIAIRHALSWQGRKLVFTETPLREVVAQFNRRNFTQLVLADASLAERPVGGTFAADNVAAFVRLLEGSGDVVAERTGDREIVLRKAH